MKGKQTLAGIAAGAILMLTLPISVATTMAQTSGFSDVPVSHPNYTAIMDLKARGIIDGYPDGTFKPTQTVNRVEALKIILLGASVVVPDNTGTGGFSDTLATEWYAKYLLKAKSLGVVNGYPDGTFKPTQTVNLVENLKMLINTKNINLDRIVVVSNPFADAFANQWYAKYVEYAKEQQWISGNANNMISPAQGMTRGKLAQLLYNSIHNTSSNQQNQQTQQQTQQTSNGPLTLVVNIQDMAFVKDSMTIGTGTTVEWINKDSVAHTVMSDDQSFFSGTIQPGQTFFHTYNNNGTFTYHCTIHPTMKGTIIVKPPIEVPTI